MIRIWRSYACNNSSSFRLIALFETPALAAEVTGELRAFLRVQAEQVDATLLDDDTVPSPAQLELAKRYGFEPRGQLQWGGGRLTGDEPILICEGDTVVVQHDYCDGFQELLGYFAARGAATDHEYGSQIELSMLFTAAPDLEMPWPAVFRDASTVGAYLTIEPKSFATLKTWFAERGIAPVIQIADASVRALFARIARARCTACGGGLEYLDPRLHDIETPQLVCKPCGGLYDLSAFP